VAAWLKADPGVEVVGRDRSQTYAQAATEGAPQAQQVADRWHLMKNLCEAIERVSRVHVTEGAGRQRRVIRRNGATLLGLAWKGRE
jgi:transposase